MAKDQQKEAGEENKRRHGDHKEHREVVEKLVDQGQTNTVAFTEATVAFTETLQLFAAQPAPAAAAPAVVQTPAQQAAVVVRTPSGTTRLTKENGKDGKTVQNADGTKTGEIVNFEKYKHLFQKGSKSRNLKISEVCVWFKGKTAPEIKKINAPRNPLFLVLG